MKPSLDQVVDRMGELSRHEDYTRSENYETHSKVYENEGNIRWILRKGVGLSKKMVVTGLVVSSAPLVLPPLITLSAIGIAFSLPVGFVIATYVCTDKLMNTLLPMPPKIPCLESREMSSEEEEYRFDDEVDEGYEEDDDDEDDDDINVQRKTFKENTRKETVEENDRETRDEHGVMPIHKGEQNVEESGYEEDVDEDVDVEEQTIDSTKFPIIMEGIQEPEEEISVMDRDSAEMPKESLRAFAGEIGGKNENNIEQLTKELAFVPPRDDGNLADIDEEVNETVDKKSEEGNETGIANVQPKLNKGEDLVTEDAVDLSFDYHEARLEPTSMSEHAATRLDQGSTTDSKKEMVNEEKIWQHINAMRTVIGYKIAPLASCVEELESLYVFTGVELPVSSKDAADLADVNEKLHSLMSIVGVK